LVFVTDVSKILKADEPRLGITGATEALLRKLLRPHFFTLEVYTQLVTQIGQCWQPESNQRVGAILLDADNQTLDIDKEQWLQDITQTAINYRFAFANWKTRNADIDLKKRGYYLLHAPAGDDMADGLMIAFASNLPQHYSEVKSIFICSNDRTFDTLMATLPKYGVTCYRVIQPNRHRLRIHNHQIGNTYEYQPPIPEKQDFINQILELVLELQKGEHPWIPIITLARKYEKKYGLTIQEILKQRASEHSSFIAFLRSQSHRLAIHQLQGRKYLCLFTPPPQSPLLPPQTNVREMNGIIRELLQSQGKLAGEYVSFSVIATGYIG